MPAFPSVRVLDVVACSAVGAPVAEGSAFFLIAAVGTCEGPGSRVCAEIGVLDQRAEIFLPVYERIVSEVLFLKNDPVSHVVAMGVIRRADPDVVVLPELRLHAKSVFLKYLSLFFF